MRDLPSDIEIFYIYSQREEIDFSREDAGFYSEEISSDSTREEAGD